MDNIEQFTVIAGMVYGIVQSIKGVLPNKLSKLIPMISWVIGGILGATACMLGFIQVPIGVGVFDGILAALSSNGAHSQFKHIKKKKPV